MIMIEEMRAELQRRTTNGPHGELSRLARATNWAPGTLAMFKRGTYTGNNTLIAETLYNEFTREGWERSVCIPEKAGIHRHGNGSRVKPGGVTATVERVNRYLEAAPKGTAARLAREADMSPGTLSKFRKGSYCGDAEIVARKLATVLDSEELALQIASGRAQLRAWLVNTVEGLRLVENPEVMDLLRNETAERFVCQIWTGERLQDIEIVKGDVE